MERGRPFVGRLKELGRLQTVLDGAIRREGRLVLLVGEAGVTVSQIHVFRVSGTKIVEAWGTRDDLGLMRQLGVLPAAPAPHR